MYGDLVRDSLSLCASTLRVVLGSSRGPARPGLSGAMLRVRACVAEFLPPDTSQG